MEVLEIYVSRKGMS